jgi:hypothetical protein
VTRRASTKPIDRPIFFIGMPRSGTTVAFEAFAARRDVAWPSKHLERAPNIPATAALSRLADLTPALRRSVSRSDQARPWLEKLRVGPAEAYRFWGRCCGEKFPFDYLLGVEATDSERSCVRDAVGKVLRYHGKPRFAAKITGPGRIGYLVSIFPDARFVHVVRDGRAVVRSLMEVPFWRERDRMDEPAWRNGLLESDLSDWRRHGDSPPALAAVQWRRVVESTREEAARFVPDRYAEVRYERFVEDPGATLDEVASFCELPPSDAAKDFLSSRFELRNMNYQWQKRFDPGQVEVLNELMGGTLTELGYGVDPPKPPESDPLLSVPFGR